MFMERLIPEDIVIFEQVCGGQWEWAVGTILQINGRKVKVLKWKPLEEDSNTSPPILDNKDFICQNIVGYAQRRRSWYLDHSANLQHSMTVANILINLRHTSSLEEVVSDAPESLYLTDEIILAIQRAAIVPEKVPEVLLPDALNHLLATPLEVHGVVEKDAKVTAEHVKSNSLLKKGIEAALVEAQDSLAQATKQNDILRSYCVDLTHSSSNAQRRLENASRELEDAKKRIAALVGTVKVSLSKQKSLEEELQSIKMNNRETLTAEDMRRGELAATKDELAATKEELTATKEELAATKEELAATKEELAATKEELANYKSIVESAIECLVDCTNQGTNASEWLVEIRRLFPEVTRGDTDNLFYIVPIERKGSSKFIDVQCDINCSKQAKRRLEVAMEAFHCWLSAALHQRDEMEAAAPFLQKLLFDLREENADLLLENAKSKELIATLDAKVKLQTVIPYEEVCETYARIKFYTDKVCQLLGQYDADRGDVGAALDFPLLFIGAGAPASLAQQIQRRDSPSMKLLARTRLSPAPSRGHTTKKAIPKNENLIPADRPPKTLLCDEGAAAAVPAHALLQSLVPIVANISERVEKRFQISGRNE